MKTVTVHGMILPALLVYEHGSTREVASFVDNRFYARGGFDEVNPALNNTWNTGALGKLVAEGNDVKLVVDQPSYYNLDDAHDSMDLCWSGPRLTVSQFRDWLDVAVLATVVHHIENGEYGKACTILRVCRSGRNGMPSGGKITRWRDILDDLCYTDVPDPDHVESILADVTSAYEEMVESWAPEDEGPSDEDLVDRWMQRA